MRPARLLPQQRVPALRCAARVRPRRAADGGPRRQPPPCAASDVAACNWLAAGPGELCASCRLTRTRPADGDTAALAAFAAAEADKRRLLFNLRSLGLDLEPRDEATGTGVAFDLLASDHAPVTTGHAGGVITLDLAESDAVHREQVRALMREPYRTVLGHFRHEIGHHLFPVLVHEGDLAEVRERFGDETTDYQAALDRHYADGAPEGWASDHVSEYATMHPAEDWAETFAHYLHIRATLADGSRLPAPCRWPRGRGRRPALRGPGRGRPDQLRRARRHLAAAVLRAQRGESQPRGRRPVPVRAATGRPGQARARARSRRAGRPAQHLNRRDATAAVPGPPVGSSVHPRPRSTADRPSDVPLPRPARGPHRPRRSSPPRRPPCAGSCRVCRVSTRSVSSTASPSSARAR